MAGYFLPLVAALAVIALTISFLRGRKQNLPPTISGWIPWVGCAFEYGKNPPKLLVDGYKKFGDVFSLYLFGERMTIMAGREAVNMFFTAGEPVFSANQAYQFTVPVFGKGVVYDVEPDILVEQKKLIKGGLTTSRFRSYVDIIAEETHKFFDEAWGDQGEQDLLSAFNSVTVLTSTRCLQGEEVRNSFTADFAKLYLDLDAALSPVGFFFPNAPLPAMRRRDNSRKQLGILFSKIMKKRRENPEEMEKHPDIMSTLMNCTYKDGTLLPDEEIVGMLVALLLAGQHTSNVTGTWLGLFLLNNKNELEKVMKEQADVLQGRDNMSYDDLVKMEVLERAMMETLRMRPPIIMLMRRVLQDVEYKGYVLPKGSLVSVAPVLTHNMEENWPEPNKFNPDRHLQPKSDRYAFIAFGAGRHQCSGESFAYVQIKTIWSTLLHKYDMEMVTPFPDPDYTTLIAGPQAPVMIRYKKKQVKA